VEAIKVLLSHHAGNIDAADREGQTPLMVAVRAQQQPSALVLTASGAKTDVSARRLMRGAAGNGHVFDEPDGCHERARTYASTT